MNEPAGRGHARPHGALALRVARNDPARDPAGSGAASRFTLSETVELIHRYGGLAVAAHGLPLVSWSDCHFLEDMGTGSTMLEVSAPSFDEIAKALGMVDGRRCAIA